jgi:hypothetical protein
VGKKDIADLLSIKLHDKCHEYFSSGDLYLYNASQMLDTLAKITVNSSIPLSPVHTITLSKCIDLLCKAAKYWNSLGNVREGQQSASEQNVSELSRNCSLLRMYGEIGYMGIVKVCMISAFNFNSEEDDELFKNSGLLRNNVSGYPTPVYPGIKHTDILNDGFPKYGFRGIRDDLDVGLYHSGSMLTGSDCEEGKKACYNCLLKEIIHVKNDIISKDITNASEREIDNPLFRMIEFSLAICNCQLYRVMLYNRLLHEDENLLLGLKADIDLENFLKEKHPEVLYR